MQSRSIQRGRPKGTGTGKARELTPQEIERLTRCTQNLRDRALIWVAMGAGLRIGECMSMLICHVASDGSVLVERSRAKSRRSRRVHLAPQALRHLRSYLETRPNALPTEPLFPSRTGACMRANWGVRLVDKLFAQAGIEGASSHSLRRTHANTLRRSGVDIVVIQGQLGHARLDTTAAYLSASEVERSAALSRIKF